MEFDEIRDSLQKILEAFHKDRKLLIGYYKTAIGDTHITVNNIIDLSCNHLFDDHHDLFNIKRAEALKIRSYIHNEGIDKFKKEMISNFSNLLEK